MQLLWIVESLATAEQISAKLQSNGIQCQIGYAKGKFSLNYLQLRNKTPGSIREFYTAEQKQVLDKVCRFSIWVTDANQYDNAVALIQNENIAPYEPVTDESVRKSDDRSKQFRFYLGALFFFSVIILFLTVHIFHRSNNLLNFLMAFWTGVMLHPFLTLTDVKDIKTTFTLLGNLVIFSIFGTVFLLINVLIMNSKTDAKLALALLLMTPPSFILSYLIFYALLFGKDFLPTIQLQSLIVYNTAFLIYYFSYLFPDFSSLDKTFHSKNVLLLLPILMSAPVLLKGLWPFTSTRNMSAFYYAWYLIIEGMMLLLIIIPQTFDLLRIGNYTMQDCAATISLGVLTMSFLIDMLNVLALFFVLIPIPFRGLPEVSYKDRMQMIKERLEMLGSKYHDENPGIKIRIFLIASVILVIALNHAVIHLNPILLLNIILLMGRYLTGNISFSGKS